MSSFRRSADIVVFLGPSLPASIASKRIKARFAGPARQGDVFRALDEGATAIVLIDGVFEASPSVWHHELIAAHASGLRVFGASSMGALRAAELPGIVEPLGTIARRFVDGTWNDDAHVALLHGDASSQYRPLTLPWVNVWATAEAARRRRVLTGRETGQLTSIAEQVFYQSRTWATVLTALPWRSERVEALRQFVKVHAVDLKAHDARLALEHVERLRRGRQLELAEPRTTRFSSFVRRARTPLRTTGGEVDGTRRLLLADFARQAGIEAPAERIAWWESQLAPSLAPDLRRTWAEALALEELILSAPEHFVPDGPSLAEGAALAQAMKRPPSRR